MPELRATIDVAPKPSPRRKKEPDGPPPGSTELVARDPGTAWLLRETVAAGASEAAAANFLVNELPRVRGDRAVEDLPFGGREIAALLKLVADGTISTAASREVLAELATDGGDPVSIVERRGLRQLSDDHALVGLVDEVLSANAQKAEQYRAGKTGLLGFFVGQVMQRSGGRANPERVKELLLERLS